MSARLPLKPGSSDARGDDVSHWQRWGKQYASAYGDLMGPVDGYYGNGDAAFTREMQRRLGLPQTGVFDELNASRVGYGGTVAPRPRRKIWLYSSPGSGADWNVGPSFALGEWCKDVLKINHQPLSFQKGGYLGLLGGDAKFSYNEVTYDQYKSLQYCLDHNPDINDPDLELWFSGYSQSADGMEDALEILFGDGGFIHPGDPTRTPSPPGKYRHLRDRINGVVQFGNPRHPSRASPARRGPRGWPSWCATSTPGTTSTPSRQTTSGRRSMRSSCRPSWSCRSSYTYCASRYPSSPTGPPRRCQSSARYSAGSAPWRKWAWA